MGSQFSASLSWPLFLQTAHIVGTGKLEAANVSGLKLTTSHSSLSLFSEGPGWNRWPYGSLQVNSGTFLSSDLPVAGVCLCTKAPRKIALEAA